jgi:hypothetical protein
VSPAPPFDEGDVMQPFTIGFGRTWFLRAWGRNELVRSTDRWQAWVLSVAVTLAVIALPIAAALGTAVHDARLATYTEQAHDRHVVSATVVSETATILHGNPVVLPRDGAIKHRRQQPPHHRVPAGAAGAR